MIKKIKLGNVPNIFGTNGSRDVPKNLVDSSNFGAPQDCKINWSSHTSGTIVLVGKGNYAQYGESYYFLDIVIPLDNNEKRFTYTIYRDEWAEFILTKKSVKGTLIKTNDEKILGTKLQTTSSTLSNFGNTEIITLKHPERHLNERRGVVSIKLPVASTTKLTSWVVTREAFNSGFAEFQAASNDSNVIVSASKIQPLFQSESLLRTNFRILAQLRMTEVKHGSHDLFDWLVQWLEENKGYLNICVVNNAASAGIETGLNVFKENNDLTVVYCIEKALVSGLLSTAVEGNSFISEVDLSGLTAIKLVSKKASHNTGSRNVLDFFVHATPTTKVKFTETLRNKEIPKNFGDDVAPGSLYRKTNHVGIDFGQGENNKNIWRWGVLMAPLSSSNLFMNLVKDVDRLGSFFGSPKFIQQVNASRYLIGTSMFIRPNFFVKDDDGTSTKEVDFILNLKKSTVSGADKFTPVTVRHRIPVDVKVGDIWNFVHGSPTASNCVIPVGESFKGVVLMRPDIQGVSSVYQVNHPVDGTNLQNCLLTYENATDINTKPVGALAATEFQFGRLNLALVDTHTISAVDFVGLNNNDFTGQNNVFYEADFQHNTKLITYGFLSPFFINFDRGTFKSNEFKDLPVWSKVDVKYYVKRMQVEHFWWEHRHRARKSDPWGKPVEGDWQENTPGKHPRDPITDDPVRLDLIGWGSWQKIYYEINNNLDEYLLDFRAVAANQIYYGYTRAWNTLPKVVPSLRTGKYITWGKVDRRGDNTGSGHNGTWDILGAKTSDKTTYISDHLDVADYAVNEDRHVNGLAQIIFEMYNRFSSELVPQGDDQKKGFYFDGPTEKDFQTGVQIFDLVGTDYFMVVNKSVNAVKPKISLIIKNNDLVQGSGGSVLYTDKHKPIDNILLAINQHNSIFLYGHVFDIKTKLTFHEHNAPKSVKWSLRFTPYTLGLPGLDEYYSYTFKGPLEYIEDRFTINKVQKSVIGSEVERSRLVLERDMYNAQRKLDLVAVENTNINNRTSLNTAIEDFGIAKDAANRGGWAGLLTGGIAGGAAGVMGVAMGSNNTKTASWAGAAMGGAGAAMALAGSTINSINSASALGESNYKNARDLDDRARQMGKQIEIDRNQADHTHKYAEIRMRKELARISSHRVDPSITDRNVLDAFLKSHQRSICHLVHSTPSPEILKHLELFFNEYGADLIAENYVVDANYFGDELVNDRILQFTSVVSDDITDINLLRNLQGRLVNGIKIKI